MQGTVLRIDALAREPRAIRAFYSHGKWFSCVARSNIGTCRPSLRAWHSPTKMRQFSILQTTWADVRGALELFDRDGCCMLPEVCRRAEDAAAAAAAAAGTGNWRTGLSAVHGHLLLVRRWNTDKRRQRRRIKLDGSIWHSEGDFGRQGWHGLT